MLGTGGVKCWGLDYGLVPVDVPDLGSGAAVLSVGGFHACVIMTTGAARCWGNNPFGQLGDGTTTASSVPVTVTEMTSGTLAIAAGTDHTCAVIGSGGVRCWGNGARGALGNNNLNSQQANPTDVIGISSGATALAAGNDNSCALVSGLARCWGYNGSGSLGDGTRVQRNTPVAVAGLPAGMTQLYTAGAFASHICAIDSNGGAFCWGANYSAQVGDGTQADRLAGTPVSGLSSGVTQIVGGAGHTCALITAGAVKCWGSRLDGQVGDGTFGYSVVPVYVGNPLPENPIRTFLPVAQANN